MAKLPDGVHVMAMTGTPPLGLVCLKVNWRVRLTWERLFEGGALGTEQTSLKPSFKSSSIRIETGPLFEPRVIRHCCSGKIDMFRQAQKPQVSRPPVYNSVGKNPAGTRLIIHEALW